MDDLYPSMVGMDPLIERLASHTTRDDFMRISAKESYVNLPEGIEEQATLEWTQDDFEESLIARVLEESHKDALECMGGAGPSIEADEEQRIIGVERSTRVEWESWIGTHYHLWLLKQAHMRQVQ